MEGLIQRQGNENVIMKKKTCAVDYYVLYNTYERARRFPHHYYIRDVMIKRKKREHWDKRDKSIYFTKTNCCLYYTSTVVNYRHIVIDNHRHKPVELLLLNIIEALKISRSV
jgi:hypothetical protein